MGSTVTHPVSATLLGNTKDLISFLYSQRNKIKGRFWLGFGTHRGPDDEVIVEGKPAPPHSQLDP